MTAEPTKVAPNVFHADFDAGRVAALDDMRRIVETGERQIADARPAGRFAGDRARAAAGRARRPYAGRDKRAGVDRCREDGKLLPPDELAQASSRRPASTFESPVVTSCGSGVTAAVITLALETLGHTRQQALRRLMDRMGRARRHAGRHRQGLSMSERRDGEAGAYRGDRDLSRNDARRRPHYAPLPVQPAGRAAEDAQHAAAFLPLSDGPGRPQMALGERAAG